jgi:hypothetical protein
MHIRKLSIPLSDACAMLGAGLPGAACAAESAESADDWTAGLLETAAFARPFVAEIHSPQLKVELGYSKSYSEFNLTEETEKFDRPIVEAHIGAVLPLYARRWGEWSFGAMLPISVHVLEDMFDPVTAPVINTDYRFGGPRFAVMRHLSDTGFVRNFSVSWLPRFHECTHLGDEITLYRKDADLPITRINVSYGFTDLQLTLNDPAGLTDTVHSFRGGLSVRLSDRELGWFGVRESVEIDDETHLEHSDERLEYYLQYQFQRADGPLASPRALNVVSLEARRRLRYGYPIYKYDDATDTWETTPVRESMTMTFNVYAGWKFRPASAERPDDLRALGLYFHFYRGINPYGQLRNYPGYPFFGVSLTYDG